MGNFPAEKPNNGFQDGELLRLSLTDVYSAALPVSPSVLSKTNIQYNSMMFELPESIKLSQNIRSKLPKR